MYFVICDKIKGGFFFLIIIINCGAGYIERGRESEVWEKREQR